MVVGDKSKKRFQIGPVGRDGIFRQPFLDGKVLKKKPEMIDGSGALQWRDGLVEVKKALTAEPLGFSIQNRLLTRLNLRSLRRASAALRRFLTLGFS